MTYVIIYLLGIFITFLIFDKSKNFLEWEESTVIMWSILWPISITVFTVAVLVGILKGIFHGKK